MERNFFFASQTLHNIKNFKKKIRRCTAVTGEDVADIIDKLRSEYQGAKAKWVWEGDEETGDWVWSETGE